MNDGKFRFYGFATGACYLAFWWAFIALLPIGDLTERYASLISSRYWFPVNLFQAAAVVFFSLFSHEAIKRLYGSTPVESVMAALQFFSLFVFGSVAFYETFLWPIFARIAPDALDILHGEVFTDMTLRAALIAGGLAMMASNIFLGARLRRVNKAFGVLYAVGFGAFCLGFMINPIRYALQSAGLTIFSASLVAFGARARALIIAESG